MSLHLMYSFDEEDFKSTPIINKYTPKKRSVTKNTKKYYIYDDVRKSRETLTAEAIEGILSKCEEHIYNMDKRADGRIIADNRLYPEYINETDYILIGVGDRCVKVVNFLGHVKYIAKENLVYDSVLDKIKNFFNVALKSFDHGLVTDMFGKALPYIEDESFISLKAIKFNSKMNLLGLYGYTIDIEDRITITNKRNLTKLVIPSFVPGIEPGQFIGCTSLQEAVLHENIYHIPKAAFMDCSNLQEINLPDEIRDIYDEAFCNCSMLPTVTLPKKLFTIGKNCFSKCINLTHIDIPDGVRMIGENAFYGCENLKSITLPQRLIELGSFAFKGCYSLEEVILRGAIDIGDCFNLDRIKRVKCRREHYIYYKDMFSNKAEFEFIDNQLYE